MKKLKYVLLLAFLLRIFKLGQVPLGFSPLEMKLGIYLSKFITFYPKEIIYIRLPFVLIGLGSIFLTYLLIKSLSSEKIALFTALFISILPWHVYLSRQANFGIVIFFIFLLFYFSAIKLNIKFKYISIIFALLGLTFSLLYVLKLFSSEVITYQVIDRRTIASYSDFPLLRFMSNKLTTAIDIYLHNFYRYLDIGNYFFRGQPRPRLGVEEIKKAYIFMLPLVLHGAYVYIKRKKISFLAIIFLSISLSLSLNYSGAIGNVLLILFIAYFSSISLKKVLKSYKFAAFFLIAIALFESAFYFTYYFGGKEISNQTKHKPHYEKMVELASNYKRDSEEVFVSDQIINADLAFQYFYNDNFNIGNVENTERSDYLFVDFLQGSPSPADRLYREDGSFPDNLDIIDVITDGQTNEKIVIYRKK